MVNVREVKASELIERVAEKLKEDTEQPEWTNYVKTGQGRENKPEEEDWWFKRSASILRKVYLNGEIGVKALREWYGGGKRKGPKPKKHTKASGKIIRKALQQLEAAGYVEKSKKGRKLTPKGRSLLESTTVEIKSQ